MANDLSRLLETIRELLGAEQTASSAPLLERMEHTLTDGYARALALEGETLRIEREIGAILANMSGGRTGDLTALTERLRENESELRRLRSTLTALRRRVEDVRLGDPEAATRSRSGPRTPRPGYGFRSAAS